MTTTTTVLEQAPAVEHTTQAGGGPGQMAHIVKTPDPAKESGAALTMRARVEGFEVEALCGYRWVPHRNPKDYPVCPACKEIYETYGAFGGWGGKEDLPHG